MNVALRLNYYDRILDGAFACRVCDVDIVCRDVSRIDGAFGEAPYCSSLFYQMTLYGFSRHPVRPV